MENNTNYSCSELDCENNDNGQCVGDECVMNEEMMENGEGFISTHLGKVVYDNMNCNFYSHSIKQEFSRSMSCNINESVEIIGNIHENNNN